MSNGLRDGCELISSGLYVSGMHEGQKRNIARTSHKQFDF
jgi:hypothetical protein